MLKQIKFLINKKYRLEFYILAFLNFFGSLLETIGLALLPISIVYIIDSKKIIEKLPFMSQYISNEPSLVEIGFFFGFIILIFLIKNLVLFIIFFIENNFTKKIRIYHENLFYTNYLNQPFGKHQSEDFYKILTNILDEISISVNTISNILGIIKDTFLIILITILLIIGNNYYSFIVLFLMLLVSAIIYLSLKGIIKKDSNYSLILRSKIMKIVNESLSSIQTISFLNRKGFFLNNFSNLVIEAGKTIVRLNLFTHVGRFIIEILLVIAFFLILYLYLLRGFSFIDLAPEISLLAVASLKFAPAFNGIISNISNLKNRMVSLNKIQSEYLRLERDIKNFSYSSGIKPSAKKHFIELKNLSFQYENSSKLILDNVSFSVEQGEVISLNGPSGSGKSTLIKILLCMYMPQKGNIFFKGKSVYDDISRWQKKISYVDQNVVLFDESINYNICLGLGEKEINFQRLEEIYDLCDITEIINDLPEGLSISVGRDGQKLSGGQKQRIGLARSLYFESDIIVLDEATNSLDKLKQKNILQKIHSMKNKTIIKISHRTETLEDADKKILIENGKIHLEKKKYE